MIALVAAVVLVATPAARLGEETIPIADVDTATEGRAAALEAELAATAKEIVGVLVAERAGSNRSPEVRLTLPTAAELAFPLEPDRAVARVDGQRVDAAELERRGALRLYRLRGELARVRRRALDEILERRLLEREARRRGLSVDALVDALPVDPIDAAEIAATVAAATSAGRPAPDPARVRPLLEARARHRARAALVGRLRDEAGVEILLADVQPPRLTVSSRDGPSLGPARGPTIVLFADYRSSAARQVHREIDRVRARRPDVRVVLRDFVPEEDELGMEAALLARCADRAGGFAAMREALLVRAPPAPGEAWIDAQTRARLASKLEVGAESLDACVAAADVASAVRADSREARALGFEEPPAILVEGRPFGGRQTAETIEAALAPVP